MPFFIFFYSGIGEVKAVEHTIVQAGKVYQGMRRGCADVVRLGMSMLRIGAIGFGGGNALIPVIEKEVVESGKLVTKRAYDEDVVAACITPGALPVEIAAGIGQRLGGHTGMLMASSMMALPGAFFTVLILAVLTGEQGAALTGIRYVSIGLGAFIISLLLAYVLKTLAAMQQAGTQAFCTMCLAMAAVFLLSSEANLYALLGLSAKPIFNLSVLAILGLAFFLIIGSGISRAKATAAGLLTAGFLLSGSHLSAFASSAAHDATILVMAWFGLMGLVKSFRMGGESVDGVKFFRDTLREASAWIAFTLALCLPAIAMVQGSPAYIGEGFLSSLLSFGGGDAYLTIADGLFVQGGTVAGAEFYGQLVPVANALPGSILCKILTGIGYLAGFRAGGMSAGLALSLAGFAVSVAASGLIFGIIARLLRTFHDVPVFRQISLWVRPIISGLLPNVALSMLRTNLETGAGLFLPEEIVLGASIALAALCLYLLCARRKAMTAPMLVAAATGLGLILI